LPSASVADCDEGNLEWVDKDMITELPLWEGDKIFLRLLQEREQFFSLKLRYEGEKLKESVLYED
jgi:8-oxo-dGTP diphosphatase